MKKYNKSILVLILIFWTIFLLIGCDNKKSSYETVSEKTVSFPSNTTYTIKIVQSKFVKPPTPGEINFDMYNSGFYGRFDIISLNEAGKEVDRVGLNELFNLENIGFIGKFELFEKDLNNDGKLEFSIGQPAEDKSGEFKFLIFSIDKGGQMKRLPASGYKEDGYLYTQANNHSAKFEKNGGNNEIEVTVEKPEKNGYTVAAYIWDTNKFVFKRQ